MNSFDIILILTILISITHGLMRGFLGSLTGLPLMISAIYLSSLLTPTFKEWLNFYGAKVEVQNWAFGILTLFLILFFTMLASFLRLCLEKFDQKWIDQFLGFLWGMIRALAVLKLIALILVSANMNRLISESFILNSLAPFLKLDFGLKFW